MLTMPLTTSGLNSLQRTLYAHGNAANSTLRQVAGSIGTSIIITIMSKGSLNSTATNPLEAQVSGMNLAFASIGALTFIGLIEELRVSLNKKVDLLRLSDMKNNIELVHEIMKDGIKIYG